MRLRATASPTAFPTMKPTFGLGSPWATPGWARRYPVSRRPRARTPVRTTRVKSRRDVIRAHLGTTTRIREPSRGQLVAALTPTSCEYRPAGPGAHAQAEAVRPGTPPVVGLKGALAHGENSWAEDVDETASLRTRHRTRAAGPPYGTDRSHPGQTARRLRQRRAVACGLSLEPGHPGC